MHTVTVDELPHPVAPARSTSLLHDDNVNCVVGIPERGLVATGSIDGSVRVYALDDPSGIPLHTMFGHAATVENLVHVEGDVLASAGEDGKLIMWSAEHGRAIEALWLSNHSVRTVASRAGHIIVGTTTGDLITYAHQGGRHLTRVSRTICAHKSRIWNVIIAGSVLLTGAKDHTVDVWNIELITRRAVLVHTYSVRDITASDGHIVTCSADELRVYRNGADYALLRVVTGLHVKTGLDERSAWLNSVNFIGAGTVVTASFDGILTFTDVETARPVARVRTACNGIYSATVLPCGRVVVTEQGDVLNEIIELPRSVLELIFPEKSCPPRSPRFGEPLILIASFLGIVTIALARRRR